MHGRRHGLKKSSMHPWISRYREKFSEKFKAKEFFSESEIKHAPLSDPLISANTFIEIREKPKSLKNLEINERIKLKIQDLEFEFSTFPQVEWLSKLIN